MSFELPVVSRKALTILQIIGGLIFLASFFMDAVYIPAAHDGSWGDVARPINGLLCATFSLVMLAGSVMSVFKHSFNAAHPNESLGLFLAGVSGLINPLIPCCLTPARKWQRVLAGVIVIQLVSAWAAIRLLHYSPLLGFISWQAGILLILSPQLSRSAYEPSSEN